MACFVGLKNTDGAVVMINIDLVRAIGDAGQNTLIHFAADDTLHVQGDITTTAKAIGDAVAIYGR